MLSTCPKVLDHAIVDVTPGSILDPYFADATQIAIQNVGGQIFVASRDKNLFAFDIINKNEPSETIRIYEIYNLITRGLIPSCY